MNRPHLFSRIFHAEVIYHLDPFDFIYAVYLQVITMDRKFEIISNKVSFF